ncbi:hypothetical protein PF005_g14792 [Phytophthora fragariae]|uniref:Uncharacterized protein n=2 Tax=Phytophthora TaxID=4783 RepID=A0A6A3ELR0_9STRA|nr:hypothetical protein PF003_g22635 [Phytophthora fragariae]KAE8933356.1 hypothetical protein PF009_g16640 [Phytophthora fragariae]KAE9000092.1 hypothetical protein PF011_g14346 [Phytophthora fragariae]KAE9100491.1 hypothetical protein PF010_g14800 [Phytophthora fragariae]KAE9100996.1 hypothetical protein PF007_g15313 [Phytophthora fragariae]
MGPVAALLAPPPVVPLLQLLLLLLLLLGVVCLMTLCISRSGKQRPTLRRFEHTRAFPYDRSQAKPQAETAVTLGPVATSRSPRPMATARRPATSAEAILQFVLDALHHLTGLPLLMVNQPDHNLPCLTRASAIETQMRADQKNAELLDRSSVDKGDFPAASWSDDEAPEEEISDLSSDEKEQQDEVDEEQDSDMEDGAEIKPVTSTAQSQLFDGMQFYLAVSQVRERTVRSVLALGMAKTLTTLRERKQNESIAVIEQRYPDFTCLPTRNTAVQQLPGPQQPTMDLLAALRLPTAAAVAQSQSPMKGPVRARIAADEEGRVRRPSLPSHGPNISRVA